MHGAGPFDVTTISLAMLANRISYHFNLMGPSITHCTACSASLIATHSAINALMCGDCEQAIVGSVNYLGAARVSASFAALGVISPEGKCHSFDAAANGYMRSEGSLRVRDQAARRRRERRRPHPRRDRSEQRSMRPGAADGSGRARAGTLHHRAHPARTGRADAHRLRPGGAGRPQDFDYIEAHATGTVVGDRIEGNAIAQAFGGADRSHAAEAREP